MPGLFFLLILSNASSCFLIVKNVNGEMAHHKAGVSSQILNQAITLKLDDKTSCKSKSSD